VRFVHAPDATALPFPDASFDGIAAASSIEQAPEPKATLRELRRVLKRGGVLRMHYESLGYYKGWNEREAALLPQGARSTLVVYDRDIASECVRHYQLLLGFSAGAITELLAGAGHAVRYSALTPRALTQLREHLVCARTWTTRHPSCLTWSRWLAEAGFAEVTPTHNGGWFSAKLFDHMPDSQRPKEMERVDAVLRPIVGIVVSMKAAPTAAPREWDPWLTAVA
jgi:SAM-dependent methyltransferase